MSFELVQSICAECGRPVPAVYMRLGDAVYLEKTCAEHGISRVLASENAEAFERWIAFPSVTVPPRVFLAKGAGERSECPLHCGPCENHLMTACCVLLNVTNRCNQHCPWCFAEAGELKANDVYGSEPALADIGRWLDLLTELGEERKFNIQLSGGEPTVRGDLPEIIGLCRKQGFEYVQLNTNGRKLAEDPAYAKELKAAGLSTVFLQFDGVSDDVYVALRGEPLLDVKKTAIQNCAAAGLPVTLVPTVLKSVNLSQTGAIIDFMLGNIKTVKGVHFQPASFFGRQPEERNEDGDFDERVTMFAIMEEIEKQTNGRIQKSDLAPISTGHPLCCFCAAYMKEPGGEPRPISSGGPCCGSGEAASSSLGDESCYEPPYEPSYELSDGRSVVDPLEIIRRDRDFVLNKWDVCAPEEEARSASEEDGGNRAMSFDEALAIFKNNMFTISGMAFMDETNLDAERLRRCRVQVFSPEERLVPFCAYYSGGRKRLEKGRFNDQR